MIVGRPALVEVVQLDVKEVQLAQIMVVKVDVMVLAW